MRVLAVVVVVGPSQDPSAYPMFRDQVSNLCDSKFETTLKALRLRLDGVPTPEGTESATGVRGGANKEPTGLQAVTRQPPARPAGLVFHMTRCGSTLVANSASRCGTGPSLRATPVRGWHAHVCPRVLNFASCQCLGLCCPTWS